jgi:pimeloyl-ACP methyl ester carboxylesterase
MVLVSATMYYPAAARAIMRQTPGAEFLADDYDDMTFTPPHLATIAARTLIVYGDRDPLYPVEMAVEMYRAIPGAALWVVPEGGHGPIFTGDDKAEFARRSLAFLTASS